MALSTTRRGRLAVIGGGIVGLFTAYYAAPLAASVTVLGPLRRDAWPARSVRLGFADPRRATLAAEAHRLWLELQARSGRPLLAECGWLTLASARPPDVGVSAGARGQVPGPLRLTRAALSRAQLASRYPQFAAETAWLDARAGLADVSAVTLTLTRALRERGVSVHESTRVRGMGRSHGEWHLAGDYGALGCDAIVVAAGLESNDVLRLLPGRPVLPLRTVVPAEAAYVIPPAAARSGFTQAAMPGFAYPELGIHGHPITAGDPPAIMICRDAADNAAVGSVADFVAGYMPGLHRATIAVAPSPGPAATSACPDSEFVIGPVPGADGVYAAGGWAGTGYTFAPWAGLVLAQLAIGQDTTYDIARFTPARFGIRSATGDRVAAAGQYS